MEYSACCSDVVSFYFIVDKQMNLIELPSIINTYCDGPEPFIEYRFPNQKFGLNNKIVLTKSFVTEKNEVISIEVQKTYLWNGEIIELEK